MNVLMDIKTRLPGHDNSLVIRKSLYQDIDAKLTEHSRFLLVSAPAGYGKTSLVAEWLRNKAYNKAWFSLSEADTDISLFFSGIITALQKIDKEICTGLKDIIKAPAWPGIESLLSLLIDDINRLEEKLVLVIDNYHLINNDYIHNFMEKLIEFIPGNMFLVIMTREDPPLMLNRYKISGQMNEIRIKDLRFSFAEIQELYHNILSLNIDKSSIEKIYNRSEGWISGIRLAGLKIIGKKEDEVYQFINDFSGSHSYLIDYLMEEVLEELDDPTREFLYKTSIVENICPDLSDYLTDRSDSYNLLKKLEKMNLFLFSTDPNKRWYRYHQLFRDSLLTYLSPSLKRELHLKAAAWFSQAGFYRDAISAALKAEDYDLAVQNVVDCIPDYLAKGEINSLLELLKLIPEKYILNNGFLLIIKAWSLFLTGRTKDALFYLDIINRKPELIDDNNQGRLLILKSLSAFTTDIDDNSNPEKNLEELTVIAEKDQIFRLISLGQIYAYQGELEQAVKSFKNAYFLAREHGQVFMEILSLMNYALLLYQIGELQAAITLCQSNIDRFNAGANEPLAKLLYLPLGIFHYQSGDYQRAKEYLTAGLEMSEKRELVYIYFHASMYLAKTCFELTDYKEAANIIAKTLNFTKQHQMVLEGEEIANLQLEFKLRTGEISLTDITEEKVGVYQEICNQQLTTINIKYLLTYCRILLTTGEDERALACLNRIDDLTDKKKIQEDKITTRLLSAIITFNNGQPDKARDFLLKAVKLKGDEKYFSVFTKEGKALLPLLAEFKDFAPGFLEKVKNKIEDNLSAQLTGEDSTKDSPTKDSSTKDTSIKDSSTKDNLIEPLTDRELEILNLVAAGLSNKKIAERLVITPGTTKWHLSNVYAKLAVSKRTQAVAKAKELEIIK